MSTVWRVAMRLLTLTCSSTVAGTHHATGQQPRQPLAESRTACRLSGSTNPVNRCANLTEPEINAHRMTGINPSRNRYRRIAKSLGRS